MNKKENIRKATLEDVKDIQKLINFYASKNLMLPRSLTEIYENIRDFWIIRRDSGLIACCALHPLWDDMAEIKSLAVAGDYQKEGIASSLVRRCLDEAVELKARQVFALTYSPGFFEKMEFVRGDKEKMPHKIWSECIKCPHFPDCDEVLLVRSL